MIFSDLLRAAFEPLYQHPCWDVRLGYGDQLTLNFGTPKLCIREPKTLSPTSSPANQKLFAQRNVTLRGKWHLWIYFCNWRIRINGEIVGARTDRSNRRKQRAVDELDGQILTSVRVNPHTAATIFAFDLGGQLETLPYDAESEQWILFMPRGMTMTVRSDGMYSYDDAHTPPADTLWRSIAENV